MLKWDPPFKLLASDSLRYRPDYSDDVVVPTADCANVKRHRQKFVTITTNTLLPVDSLSIYEHNLRVMSGIFHYRTPISTA